MLENLIIILNCLTSLNCLIITLICLTVILNCLISLNCLIITLNCLTSLNDLKDYTNAIKSIINDVILAKLAGIIKSSECLTRYEIEWIRNEKVVRTIERSINEYQL